MNNLHKDMYESYKKKGFFIIKDFYNKENLNFDINYNDCNIYRDPIMLLVDLKTLL